MLSWLAKHLRGTAASAGSAAPAAEPDSLVQEALAHQAAGRLVEAERTLYRALALAPAAAGIHLHLGNLFSAQARYDAALQCCLEAVRLAPDNAPARNNLGNAYRSLGEFDLAVGEFRHALRLDPGLPEAHFNLALTLQKQGREDAALDSYRAARRAQPAFALAHLNCGFLLEERADPQGAIAAYQDAIRSEPGLIEAHVNLGMQLLLSGRLHEGWREYEWRLRYPEYSGADLAAIAPRWDGGALQGRTILLDAEQGFGDALQFLRYAPMVAERGGRVLVRCASDLKELVTGIAGVAAVVPRDAALPAFDVHCPLPSLPYVFSTTLENLTATVVPYLAADTVKAARWQARFAADGGGCKVGLVWASQSMHRTAPDKSVGLAALGPLASVSGVRFYSLQKGAAAAEPVPAGMRFTDLSRDLSDFSDTAAAVSGLDLVISVDTAVAHLAGALGRPVWTLLKAAPDWRWLLTGDDCPWYPTMRLFRQQQRGDWTVPVAGLVDALRVVAGAGTGTQTS